jgi:hypothetical protein
MVLSGSRAVQNLCASSRQPRNHSCKFLNSPLKRLLQICESLDPKPSQDFFGSFVGNRAQVCTLIVEILDEVAVREQPAEDAEHLVPCVRLLVCKNTFMLDAGINERSHMNARNILRIDEVFWQTLVDFDV